MAEFLDICEQIDEAKELIHEATGHDGINPAKLRMAARLLNSAAKELEKTEDENG